MTHLGLVDLTDVVEKRRNVWMVRAERFLEDLNRLLEERQRFVQLTLQTAPTKPESNETWCAVTLHNG